MLTGVSRFQFEANNIKISVLAEEYSLAGGA